jgi:hypothetical protein
MSKTTIFNAEILAEAFSSIEATNLTVETVICSHRTVEFLLFGYNGKFPDIFRGKPFPCFVSADRLKHSEKPNIFRELIRDKFKGDAIELFSRQRVAGWDAWGDEINPDAPAENQGAEPAHLTTQPCQNNSNSRNYFSYKAITSA